MYMRNGMGSLFAAATPAETAAYCSAGRFHWLSAAQCWGKSLDEWQRGALALAAAPPAAPPESLWTVPPVDGDSAQATVDDLLNRQTLEQQRLNASHVDTNIGWRAAGVAVSAGDTAAGIADAVRGAADSVKNALSVNWGLVALAVGAGVLAVAAIGGGSPRRYGR